MVGGAVRNTLLGLPHGDIDIATTALPAEVMRRAEGCRLQGGADRLRPRHRDCRDRGPAVRGDDLARGRRDLRPPRDGEVRARLEARRAAARFHHERLSLSADGEVHDHVGGRRRSRGAACALHRQRRRASRRITAHPALLPLPRVVRERRSGPRGAACGDRGARRARTALRRARAMELMKLLPPRCGAGARRDGGGRPARLRCSPACRISTSFANMAKVGDRSWRNARRDATFWARSVSGLPKMPSGCGSGCACRMPSMRGSPRSRRPRAYLAGDERGCRARADLSKRARALHRTRVDRVGALLEMVRVMRSGTFLRRYRGAGARLRFRSRAADFIARGVEKGPFTRRGIGARRGGLDQVGFSDGSARLETGSSNDALGG